MLQKPSFASNFKNTLAPLNSWVISSRVGSFVMFHDDCLVKVSGV